MKPVARFAIRVDDSKKHSLILGVNFGNSEFFKPGYIYEINEIQGEVIIKEVGVSSATNNHGEYSPVTWANAINTIAYEGTHIYTQYEMKEREKFLNEKG